jgi:hypothetical protein
MRSSGLSLKCTGVLGYGFLESAYNRAMQVELEARGIKADLESTIRVTYKGVKVDMCSYYPYSIRGQKRFGFSGPSKWTRATAAGAISAVVCQFDE